SNHPCFVMSPESEGIACDRAHGSPGPTGRVIIWIQTTRPIESDDLSTQRSSLISVRILHVVPSYLPATRYGGPIYSVHGLCTALARRGHEVHVYTTNVDGDGVSPVRVGVPVTFDEVHVTYFETGVGRRLFRSPGMRRAFYEALAGFDVVHLHSVFLWPT